MDVRLHGNDTTQLLPLQSTYMGEIAEAVDDVGSRQLAKRVDIPLTTV